MTIKFIPLPRLRLTRVRLNPRTTMTVSVHVPANYLFDRDGITYQCPVCQGFIPPDVPAPYKRVSVGVYEVGIWFHDCAMCHTPIYKVSEFDIKKYWEK